MCVKKFLFHICEGGEEYEWEEDEFCENRHVCSALGPTKRWIHNDEVHRTDGPAVERADGTKEWWLNGVQLTEAEFLAKVSKL